MKTATIVTSMLLGLLLGTTVAVANASTPTTAHSTPAPQVGVTPPPVEDGTHDEARVITIPEVRVFGTRPKSPARKSKVWTCGDWRDSSAGGRYKTCDWK